MNKEDIIKIKISLQDFIETRDINELAGRFTSGNVTKADVYDVFKKHNKERVDYFYEELLEGLDITKQSDGEMITFDAGTYIERAINEGKSLMHCVKFLILPTKSIQKYLSYLGYETTSNTQGKVKELVDKLIVERKVSRAIHFSDDYTQALSNEKLIKSQIVSVLNKTENRKKLVQDGVTISATKEYNKKTINSQTIIDMLGKDKAEELFGIEQTKKWVYKISTSVLDKKIKGDK